jgi:hypothetical protein
MTVKTMMLGVADGLMSRRGPAWAIAIDQRTGVDVYVAPREFHGAVKTSFHASGKWRHAYPEEHLDDLFGASGPVEDRSFLKWTRPPQITPGITWALRILTSPASRPVALERKDEKVIWVQGSLTPRWTEVDVFFLGPNAPRIAPTLASEPHGILRTEPLVNGESLCMFYQTIDAPVMPSAQSGAMHFYKGRSAEGLRTAANLSAVAYAEDSNGTQVVIVGPAQVAGQSR